MKIFANVKHLDWKREVEEINFSEETVEVDLSYGNGDTSEYSFDEVELSVDGETSDGYHTFNELYYQRMVLFSIICATFKDKAWKSWKHDDGTMYDDYFIVGVTTPKGDYTCHYHKDHWNVFDVKEVEFSPKLDGHKPNDIIRLYSLMKTHPPTILPKQNA